MNSEEKHTYIHMKHVHMYVHTPTYIYVIYMYVCTLYMYIYVCLNFFLQSFCVVAAMAPPRADSAEGSVLCSVCSYVRTYVFFYLSTLLKDPLFLLRLSGIILNFVNEVFLRPHPWSSSSSEF